MFKLLLTLHVLLAIFLIGPLAMIPMTTLRAIRRRDAAAVRGGARQTMIFGVASIAVFLLGFGIVGVKPKWFSLGDPWITISMTLYIIALILTLVVLVPGLRKAGKLLATDLPATPVDDEETVTATASGVAGKQKLDALYGRTAAVGGVVTLLLIAVIVLMVVQPF